MTAHTRRSSSERGSILVQVGVAIIVLIAFTAFVADYGLMWVARRQAQNAADAGALAGAGAGGATGGLIGALIGAGIPEYRAKVYEAGLKGGGILIGVEAQTDEEVERIDDLLTELGGEHVRTE